MIVTKIIEEHLRKEDEKRSKTRGTKKEYFYASDALLEDKGNSKCERQFFYEFSDVVPEPLDIPTLKTFGVGEAIHEWIQDILVKEGVAEVIEDETIEYNEDLGVCTGRVSKEENKIIIKEPVEIHGRLDCQIKHEQESIVVEIKSVKNGGFFYIGNNPKAAHVQQLQLYLDHKGLKKGVILYINKDTGEFKEFEIKHDPELVIKAKERFAEVKKRIDTGEIPNRLDIGSWQCSYCPYRLMCFKPKKIK